MDDLTKRYSIKIGNTSHVNKTAAELLAVDGIGQVTVDKLKAAAALEEINAQAFVKIDGMYPQWKQTNILRIGTDEEKATMNTYIDAVRDWANSEEPTQDQLLAIKA